MRFLPVLACALLPSTAMAATSINNLNPSGPMPLTPGWRFTAGADTAFGEVVCVEVHPVADAASYVRQECSFAGMAGPDLAYQCDTFTGGVPTAFRARPVEYQFFIAQFGSSCGTNTYLFTGFDWSFPTDESGQPANGTASSSSSSAGSSSLESSSSSAGSGSSSLESSSSSAASSSSSLESSSSSAEPSSSTESSSSAEPSSSAGSSSSEPPSSSAEPSSSSAAMSSSEESSSSVIASSTSVAESSSSSVVESSSLASSSRVSSSSRASSTSPVDGGTPPVDEPEPQGCGCDTSNPSAPMPFAVLAAFAWLVLRRRA